MERFQLDFESKGEVVSKATPHEKQGNKKKSFQCSICDKKFSARLTFVKHYKVIHEKVKEFKCKFCGKEFGQKARMITHVESIHEKIKNHKCSECEKSFTRKDQLSEHFKTYPKVLGCSSSEI